jgi:hypothetical protein
MSELVQRNAARVAAASKPSLPGDQHNGHVGPVICWFAMQRCGVDADSGGGVGLVEVTVCSGAPAARCGTSRAWVSRA